MFSYKISGSDFDTVIVDFMYSPRAICTEQYYVCRGQICGRDTVKFILVHLEGKVSLDRIETEASDIVILPKCSVQQILPYALRGSTFKRFVLSPGVKLKLLPKSLYGSDTVTEFCSLSRDVKYDMNVFPPKIRRRVV